MPNANPVPIPSPLAVVPPAPLQAVTPQAVDTLQTIPPDPSNKPPCLVGNYDNRGQFVFNDDQEDEEASLLATTGFEEDEAAYQVATQIADAAPYLCGNASLAMAYSLAPQTPLQGLLAAQTIVCHTLAMEQARKAIGTSHERMADRHLNTASRFMSLFLKQSEALQKMQAANLPAAVAPPQELKIVFVAAGEKNQETLPHG